MEKIRFITDSASDMNSSREDVTILPLHIRFGEEEYADGVTISHKEFYEKLIECDTLPTTSLVSPAVFEEAYEKAVSAGETVIVVTISSKLSVRYTTLSRHPDVGNLLTSGHIDQQRYRIITRQQSRITDTHGTQIRRLAGAERTDLFFQPQGPRAFQCGHAQRLMGMDGFGPGTCDFGQKRRQTHLLEHVEAVIAGRAVGTDANIDPGISQFGNRGDATGQFEIGTGAMRNRAAVLGQQGNFLRFQMNRMRGNQRRAKQS